MFGLSFTEVVIIAILALVLLGPDQLPTAAKTMGKALRELKRATDGLKDQFEGEMRDLDLNLDVEGRPKPTLVPPVPVIPAMPVPGQAEPPPQATPENVPGLEAAQAESDPATPAPDQAAPAQMPEELASQQPSRPQPPGTT
jgi:sec-independent protein translocase protein TatB